MWVVQTLMNDKEGYFTGSGVVICNDPRDHFLSCDPIFGSYE
jgi:hypothetical protein